MRVPQIDGAQALGQVEHVPAAVGGGGAEGHGVAAQGLGQPKRVALEVDPAGGLDLADLIVWAIGPGRRVREGARAGAIAAGGHGIIQAEVDPVRLTP